MNNDDANNGDDGDNNDNSNYNNNGSVRLCVATCYPRYFNHLININKMRSKTEIIIIIM